MNIYFIGMCVAMLIYVVVGFFVSKKVKNADDFYVAGRRAPVLLIAGSMIASYTSTGMFMGDAAQAYGGVVGAVLIFSGMQSAGYIIGAIFFGRYLRRSNSRTIPEFFGKRFASRKLQILATVTAIITMTVYLLSVLQGIGTLMGEVTGVDYRICIAIAMVVFTLIVVFSGSNGVLITDTIMAGIFTVAVVISMLVIAGSVGGWFHAVESITTNPATSSYLSWGGEPSVLMLKTSVESLVWGFVYGIVWMSVCMVGPWQSSRYLMAKNEHAIIRSAPIAAIGIFLLEFLVGMSAVFVNIHQPELSDSSTVMIWAAINILPKVLGIILLTGVLSAGISSATTFLSLIGSSVANDIYKDRGKTYLNTDIAGTENSEAVTEEAAADGTVVMENAPEGEVAADGAVVMENAPEGEIAADGAVVMENAPESGSEPGDAVAQKTKADKKSMLIARLTMIGVSVIVLILAIFNPPSIFWIMFLGGAIAASSWMPVAVASVFSKRVTKAGAFAGMLAGFLGCFIVRLYTSFSGVNLPVYLDPSIVGILCNIIAMVITSAVTKVTPQEVEIRKNMFIVPQSELNSAEISKTMKWSIASIAVGAVIVVLLLTLWVIPYLLAL